MPLRGIRAWHGVHSAISFETRGCLGETSRGVRSYANRQFDSMTDLVIRSHRIKTTTSGLQTTALQRATSVALKREGGRLVAIPIFDDEGSKGTTGDVSASYSPTLSWPSTLLLLTSRKMWPSDLASRSLKPGHNCASERMARSGTDARTTCSGAFPVRIGGDPPRFV
jgi:hypothetical protein